MAVKRRGKPFFYRAMSLMSAGFGSNINLLFILAQILDHTAATAWFACHASIASVQDQPVVGVAQKLPGHMAHEFLFHFEDVLAGGDAGPVGDAKNMRIHRHGELAESGVEYHVGGLAAYAGQGFKFGAGAWYFTGVLLDQDATGFHQVLGLGVVKADGLDVFLERIETKIKNGLRRVGYRE